MPDVTFDEEKDPTLNIRRPKISGIEDEYINLSDRGMTAFLVRHHITKTQTGAETLMILLTIIFLGAAVIIYLQIFGVINIVPTPQTTTQISLPQRVQTRPVQPSAIPPSSVQSSTTPSATGSNASSSQSL